MQETVVGCGTGEGGSALYFAHLLDLIGKSDVITIDLVPVARPPLPKLFLSFNPGGYLRRRRTGG